METLLDLEPTAIKSIDDDSQTPLYRFVYYKTTAEAWEDPTTISRLLFLLKLYPEAAAIDCQYNYPCDFVKKSDGGAGSAYARRVLLLRSTAPDRDYDVTLLVHDANYAARRGALYLLYSAIPRDAERMLVWLRLRESANEQLMRMVVSYL